MARKITAGVLVLVLLGVIIPSPASAAQISVDQVNLKDIYDFSENPWEIIPDGLGNLIISDDAGIIWKVNPVNGNYSLIDTAIVGLASARPAEGGYYFSDYQNMIGFENLNDIYLWEIPLEDENQIDHAIGRLNIDSSGAIWFIEYETSDSKIYKLTRNGSKATVCTLIPVSGSSDYGTYAYDLDFYSGYFWWFNYYEERIVRLNSMPNISGEYLMEYWDVPEGSTVVGGRENAFDSAGNFWISGGGSGTLLLFDPVTKILTTYTVPGPDSPSIEGVTINGSQVWYGDMYGSVGILNSAVVTGESINLTSASGSFYLNGVSSCEELAATMVDVYGTQSGTLGFADRSVVPDTSHPGWINFPLSENDLLSGINTAQGVVLVSAPNDLPAYRKLIRFTPENADDFKVFLPLIVR